MTLGTTGKFQHALLAFVSRLAMQEHRHGCVVIHGKVCGMNSAEVDAGLHSLLVPCVAELFARLVRAHPFSPSLPALGPSRHPWAR